MKDQYLTIKQFCQRHKVFTESSIRWKIFNAAENGIADSGAILRDGRKIIINEQIFFKWLAKKSSEQGWG